VDPLHDELALFVLLALVVGPLLKAHTHTRTHARRTA
jgi:hypothetical protein